MEKELILKGKEKGEVKVSARIRNMSSIIKDILNDYPEGKEIPLQQFDTESLQRVAEYCKIVDYDGNIPFVAPIRDDDRIENVVTNEGEREFILKLNEAELDSVLVLANFLNIPRLLDLCSIKLAIDLKLQEKEILKKFQVPAAISLEEVNKLREKFPWAFELDRFKKEQFVKAEKAKKSQ